MLSIIHFIYFFAALALGGLSLFLLVEILAFRRPTPEILHDDKRAYRIAVLIPAHNERALVAKTIESVLPQLDRDTDRIIVIADNCSDDTAAVSDAAGAQILERTNIDQRGKGFALQFGIDALQRDPPDVVIFLDADCIVGDGAIQRIARRAFTENRPIQALYLMRSPGSATPQLRVAEFAWMVMNKLRMGGLDRLVGASRITGSGIAFPWALLAPVNIASGEIVEDLAMTFAFVRNGHRVALEQNALVESEFPETSQELSNQSSRWSIGSLTYARRTFLSSITSALQDGNVALFALALDLLIPPITVLIALHVIMLATGMLLAMFGVVGWGVFLLALFGASLAAMSMLIAWCCYGRHILPPSEIKGLAEFLLLKLKVFGRKGRESAKTWTPTRSSDKDAD